MAGEEVVVSELEVSSNVGDVQTTVPIVKPEQAIIATALTSGPIDINLLALNLESLRTGNQPQREIATPNTLSWAYNQVELHLKDKGALGEASIAVLDTARSQIIDSVVALREINTQIEIPGLIDTYSMPYIETYAMEPSIKVPQDRLSVANITDHLGTYRVNDGTLIVYTADGRRCSAKATEAILTKLTEANYQPSTKTVDAFKQEFGINKSPTTPRDFRVLLNAGIIDMSHLGRASVAEAMLADQRYVDIFGENSAKVKDLSKIIDFAGGSDPEFVNREIIFVKSSNLLHQLEIPVSKGKDGETIWLSLMFDSNPRITQLLDQRPKPKNTEILVEMQRLNLQLERVHYEEKSLRQSFLLSFPKSSFMVNPKT